MLRPSGFGTNGCIVCCCPLLFCSKGERVFCAMFVPNGWSKGGVGAPVGGRNSVFDCFFGGFLLAIDFGLFFVGTLFLLLPASHNRQEKVTQMASQSPLSPPIDAVTLPSVAGPEEDDTLAFLGPIPQPTAAASPASDSKDLSVQGGSSTSSQTTAVADRRRRERPPWMADGPTGACPAGYRPCANLRQWVKTTIPPGSALFRVWQRVEDDQQADAGISLAELQAVTRLFHRAYNGQLGPGELGKVQLEEARWEVRVSGRTALLRGVFEDQYTWLSSGLCRLLHARLLFLDRFAQALNKSNLQQHQALQLAVAQVMGASALTHGFLCHEFHTPGTALVRRDLYFDEPLLLEKHVNAVCGQDPLLGMYSSVPPIGLEGYASGSSTGGGGASGTGLVDVETGPTASGWVSGPAGGGDFSGQSAVDVTPGSGGGSTSALASFGRSFLNRVSRLGRSGDAPPTPSSARGSGTADYSGQTSAAPPPDRRRAAYARGRHQQRPRNPSVSDSPSYSESSSESEPEVGGQGPSTKLGLSDDEDAVSDAEQAETPLPGLVTAEPVETPELSDLDLDSDEEQDPGPDGSVTLDINGAGPETTHKRNKKKKKKTKRPAGGETIGEQKQHGVTAMSDGDLLHSLTTLDKDAWDDLLQLTTSLTTEWRRHGTQADSALWNSGVLRALVVRGLAAMGVVAEFEFKDQWCHRFDPKSGKPLAHRRARLFPVPHTAPACMHQADFEYFAGIHLHDAGHERVKKLVHNWSTKKNSHTDSEDELVLVLRISLGIP